MDGKNFRLISGLHKLSHVRQNRRKFSKLFKASRHCSKVISVIPTHKQKNYSVVSAPGFT